MESVKADLEMYLYVECPRCECMFNLFDCDENDEGVIYDQAISDKSWKLPQDERVDCKTSRPNCQREINVKGLNW